MGGYRVHTEQIRVGVGEYLQNTSSTVDAVKSNLANITLPAPEAGTSVKGELAAVVTAWDEALPKMKKEIELLAGAVKTSATMYEKVEIQGSGAYAQFSR